MQVSNIQSFTPLRAYGKSPVNAKNVEFKGGFNPFSAPTGFNPFSTSPIDIDQEKFMADFAHDLEKVKDEIYEYLDNTEITVNGKTAPIIEHVKDLFTNRKEYWSGTLLHNSKDADKIGRVGFDFSKIKKTVYGPGMYFGDNKEDIEMYPGKTVHADFEGTLVQGKNLDKYGLLTDAMEASIKKYMGTANYYSQTSMLEHRVFANFINEYTRKQIVEKLGIDGTWTYNEDAKYYAVFNPESLSNIYVL